MICYSNRKLLNLLLFSLKKRFCRKQILRNTQLSMKGKCQLLVLSSCRKHWVKQVSYAQFRTYRAVRGANHVGDGDVSALLASGRGARTDAGIREVRLPQKMRPHDELFTFCTALSLGVREACPTSSTDGKLTDDLASDVWAFQPLNEFDGVSMTHRMRSQNPKRLNNSLVFEESDVMKLRNTQHKTVISLNGCTRRLF